MRLHKVRWWKNSYGPVYRDKKPGSNESLLLLHNYTNIKGRVLPPRAVRTIVEFLWLCRNPHEINFYAPSKRKIRRLSGKHKEYLKRQKVCVSESLKEDKCI